MFGDHVAPIGGRCIKKPFGPFRKHEFCKLKSDASGGIVPLESVESLEEMYALTNDTRRWDRAGERSKADSVARGVMHLLLTIDHLNSSL